MNNYLAMNICEAIMPIKDDSVNVNVTIVTNNGNVYNNVEVNDFDIKGVYLVMINMHLMLLTVRLLKSMLEMVPE